MLAYSPPTNFDKLFEAFIAPAAYNRETDTYTCLGARCSYANRQKSNFKTHTKTHFDFKDIRCEYPAIDCSTYPIKRCNFTTRDPGSYSRHSRMHDRNYQRKLFNRHCDPDVTLHLCPDTLRELSGLSNLYLHPPAVRYDYSVSPASQADNWATTLEYVSPPPDFNTATNFTTSPSAYSHAPQTYAPIPSRPTAFSYSSSGSLHYQPTASYGVHYHPSGRPLSQWSAMGYPASSSSGPVDRYNMNSRSSSTQASYATYGQQQHTLTRRDHTVPTSHLGFVSPSGGFY